MKSCPKCKKTHNKSGIYCGHKCANSRVQSYETKLKKSIKQKAFLDSLTEEEKVIYYKKRIKYLTKGVRSKSHLKTLSNSLKSLHFKKKEKWLNDWLLGLIPMENTYSGIDNKPSNYIRNYLKEISGNKCQRCTWAQVNETTGLVPLQINHIDGDSTNNSPLNLEYICPNCHSLTSTYGSHGKGRKNRIRVLKYTTVPLAE